MIDFLEAWDQDYWWVMGKVKYDGPEYPTYSLLAL